MKRLILIALLCTGCQYKEPVLLGIPLNRFESPEPGARFVVTGGLSGEHYLVLTEDQRSAPPDPATARTGNCPDSDADLFGGEECGLLGLLRAVSHCLLGGQAKWFVFGPQPGTAQPGDTSLALTAAYGQGSQDLGDSPRTEIDRSLRDAALILGRRLNEAALLYGGAYYSAHRYDGRHTRTEETEGGDDGGLLDPILGGGQSGGSAEVTRPFAGRLTARGINLGLRFEFGEAGTSALTGECAWAQLGGTGIDDSRGRCGVAFEHGFGD
jgi:hypothetical protein